jgi:HAMP domain-containing protein
VIDRHGTVLVRYPDEYWVGRAHPQPPVVGAVRNAAGPGVGEVRGADGVPRLLGFSPLLDGGPAGDVYVSIGIPKDIVVGPVNRRLVWNLAGLGLVTGLAVVAARYAGDAFVVRRVNRIVVAARRLAAGDLSARAGGPYDGELGELARAFDEMAEARSGCGASWTVCRATRSRPGPTPSRSTSGTGSRRPTTWSPTPPGTRA